MKSLGGLIGLLAVALIGGLYFKYYLSSAQPAGTATPVQAIDAVGAQNDLLNIAQAERAYQAQNGRYASMDDLVSSGAITMRKDARQGYTYDVEASDDSFRAIARCTSPPVPGCQNYFVDQTMSVQPGP